MTKLDTGAMKMIRYNTENDPDERGIYACRVPADNLPGFHTDKFLMWFKDEWSHIGSDQKYRGEVTGWIGPLQRRMNGV
jgi:hypothetical protein